MRSLKLKNALSALPSDAPVVVDLARRYATSMATAARLEADAKHVEDMRERLAILREARGQVQIAIVALREASEHAHRSARVGTHVTTTVPSWLREVDVKDN